jgi:cytochrome P450
METREPNVIEAVASADPYAVYARLRGTPLLFDGQLQAWVASSAAVVDEALRHPGLRVRPPAEPVPRALLGTPAGDVFASLARMTDGASHRRSRPLVEQSARRWSLDQISHATEEAALALQGVEVNRFLTALPVQAMARALGVPQPQLDETVQWVHDFTQGIGPGADAVVIGRASEAAARLMAQGEAQGLDTVRAANRIAMMQQALDATSGLLGNAIVLMQGRPDLAREMAASPDFARDAVAELVRWNPSVHNTRRFAAEDTSLGGAAIGAGQGIVVVLAAANRDPALNPDPDTFDARRAHRRSYTFGAHAHACPGEKIAVEIVVTYVRRYWTGAGFGPQFSRITGYRPLPNARIPLFAQA